MEKNYKNHNKLSFKFILSFIFYILYFIYEVLEGIFNYILLHVKTLKKIIDKYKEKIYASKIYIKIKSKIDTLNEKLYLMLIIFLIASSGVLIYIMPFVLKSPALKIISIIIGKVFSTMNIILSSMGIKKIFKIPTIRFFRMRINHIKRKVKNNIKILKINMKRLYLQIKKKLAKNDG